MTQRQALPYARGRDKLLTKEQVCDLLSIKKTKFYELANSGEFGMLYRVGASLRVRATDVQEYITRNAFDPLGDGKTN